VAAPSLPSLDGRWFRAVAAVDGGEVGPETMFRYAEEDGEVWATYAGGEVRRGYLVGTRDGDRLEFRYVQLSEAGQTSGGHCVSTVAALPDGRLRLEETWQWESRDGSGTGAVEEIADTPAES
jgi:hypothetical protein